MKPALVIRSTHTYPVYIEQDILSDVEFLSSLFKKSARLVIITDTTVYRYYGQMLEQALSVHKPLVLSFEPGDANKTRETKAMLEDRMLANGINRDACILAVGGGVVSDMAGFLAATYCRGIPVVYLPTTLLAMVDASVGGKTGVNTPYGKNLIGAFHPPSTVLMDVSILSTLPVHEINNGFAEMLKHAFLGGRPLLNDLLARKDVKHPVHWLLSDQEALIGLLTRNVQIKKELVEKDEFDHGARQLLNFGHTFGHVVESLSHYEVSHGHAVAIGMLIESALSYKLGLLDKKSFAEIRAALASSGFQLKTNWLDNTAQVLQTMKLDKKAQADSIFCVLLEDIGQPCREYVRAISQQEIINVLSWYQKEFIE